MSLKNSGSYSETMENYSSYHGIAASNDAGEHFKSLSNTIGSNIQKISQNVSSMSKMINQLQTSQDSQELRSQLRKIQHYTQQLAMDTSTLLMELMNMPLGPDQTANKLNKSRLSDEYMSTLNQFQMVQKQAVQKTKEEVRRSKNQNFNISDALSQNKNSAGKESIIELEPTSTQARKQDQMFIQSERELQELEQRERDMQQIESDIVAVNDIFKELGRMITEQGMVVDSIEANVEHASDNVQAGAVQLHEAGNYKNKARRKKFYILLALVIIVIIIIISIVHH